MKKISLTLILIILCFGNSYSWMNISCSGCSVYDSFTSGYDTDFAINKVSVAEWGGTKWNDSSAPGCICRVDFYIPTYAGDPSVNDYYLEIYSMTGNNLNTIQGRSEKIDGEQWSDEYISFFFSPCVNYSQSTDYGFAIKSVDGVGVGDPPDNPPESDETNYIYLGFDADNNSTANTYGRQSWNDDKVVATNDANDDILMEVFTK